MNETNGLSLNEHVEALKEHGMTILENVIPQTLIDTIKTDIKSYFSDSNNLCQGYRVANQSIKPNGFNYKEFSSCSKIFETKELLDVLFKITDNKLRWLHHSDVHLNFVGAKGWHSDSQLKKNSHIFTDVNVNTEDEEYQAYRLAIYLTDHTDEEGCLYVKLGTHKGENYGEYHVDAKPGDIIIFNAKLRHMGGTSNKNERMALFAGFGLDNEHSIVHSKSAIQRQMNQNLEKTYQLSDHLTTLFDRLNIKHDVGPWNYQI